MRWGTFGALMVCLLTLVSGCRHRPEDEVLDQYKLGESSIETGDCTKYKNTLTPDSIARLQELEDLALACPAAELQKLPPSKLRQVLILRNRIDAPRLRTMSTDDLISWFILEHILTTDEAQGLFPHSVQIMGDTAILQLGEKVTTRSPLRVGRVRGVVGLAAGAISLMGSTEVVPVPGAVIKFHRINGFWYQELNADNPDLDSALTEVAKEEKLPIHEFVRSIEQEEAGKIRDNIWTPPGK